jgi:hypothetical protein
MEQLTNYLMKSGFVQAFAQTPMVNIWGFESPSAPFAPNPTPVRPEVPLPSMSPQIANMSDEEAEALLLQELERLQT